MMDNQNIYGNTYDGGYQGQTQHDVQKEGSSAFGITSFVLGVVSLLLFCIGINWITGILAIIFGIVQLTKKQDKWFAVTCIVTAVESMLLAVLLYICLFAGWSASGMDYEDFYDSYYGGDYNGGSSGGGDYNGGSDDYNYYDYYNDYYDYYDYYDGYNDGDITVPQGGGPQFM